MAEKDIKRYRVTISVTATFEVDDIIAVSEQEANEKALNSDVEDIVTCFTAQDLKITIIKPAEENLNFEE